MKFISSLFSLIITVYILDNNLVNASKSRNKAYFTSKAKHTTSNTSKKASQLSLVDFFGKAGLSEQIDNNKRKNTNNNKNLHYVKNFNNIPSHNSLNNYSFKSLSKLKQNNPTAGSKGEVEAKGQPDLTKLTDIDSKMMAKLADKSPIYEGWWTIKSPDFRNPQRFPTVTLPEESSFANIPVNEDGMRANFAANCTDPSKPVDDIWFYFRLSDVQMWYSSTKSDLNVLDSLELEHITALTESFAVYKSLKLFCFKTSDKFNKSWEMCHVDEKTYKAWVCKIKELIKMPDPKCSGIEDKNFNLDQYTEVIQPDVVIPLPSRNCNEFWNYNSQGTDWECVCSEGKEQSPIDLPDARETIASPVKPLFQYKTLGKNYDKDTLDGFQRKDSPMQILNEDGFIEIVNYDFGKLVTLDGAVYRAERVSFHTPSNHKIKGKQFPLEISIIHYGISKGDIAKQVVLNFLFEKKAGVFNMFIDDIDFLNLPNPLSKKESLDNSLYIPKILYSTGNKNKSTTFNMKPFSFYTYQGSLMFPPCTEETIQYVASDPLPIGSTVLTLFEEALRVPDLIARDSASGDIADVAVSNTLPISNRKIQERNGRPIYFYDYTLYCLQEREEVAPPPKGHYEKIPKTMVKYVYVSGKKPSGVPGSYVVSDEEAKGISVDGAPKSNL